MGNRQGAIYNPFLASAPIEELPSPVANLMTQHFDGKIGAYAYMLFVLLYIPCVSTMAVVRQEAGRRLMWFSVVWSLVVAYAAAVLFYQVATLVAHPSQSIFWAAAMLTFVVATIFFYKRSFRNWEVGNAIATS